MTDAQPTAAERLRARNQRTIYGNIETGSTSNDPPAQEASDKDDWLPFVIRRIEVDDVRQDGWMLGFAAHELEKHAEGKLKEAQDARKSFESKRPPDRKSKPQYQPPELELEDISKRYIAKEGERMSILLAGLVEPKFSEVQGSLGPLEQPLVDAIVNFSGVKPDPKAPSASSGR